MYNIVKNENRKKCLGLLFFNTEISSDTKIGFGSVCSDSKSLRYNKIMTVR